MLDLLARVIGFVMALALSVAALASILDALGTSAPLMQAQMERFAPPSYTGLPADEYPGMAQMITGYLAGDIPEFQYTLLNERGLETQLFQAHERQHMADCRGLFALDRTVLLVSAAALAVLALAAFLLHDRRRTAAGFFIGTMVVVSAVAVVAALAVTDFDSLFILFHQLSFSNELWLLNPATDLLIRLMPTAFFMDYAAKLAIGWGLALLAMAVVSALVWRAGKHKR